MLVNDKAICFCVVPDRLVGSQPGEPGVENVYRTGEELAEAADELWREIRVKQQLQWDARSRPACEA